MARILVAGGLYEEEDNEALAQGRKHFAKALGRKIIAKNHVLLGGCRTDFDAEVANAAADEATKRGLDPRRCIRSWVTGETRPVHRAGEVTRSSVGNWSHVPRGFAYPEPFREADVVVIVGGWEGTHYAASWARLANKPLIPVATFGLAAAEIFEDEVSKFDERYLARISQDDFHILNRLLPDYGPERIDAFADEVVGLAVRMITPTEAFVIMSFADNPSLIDAYETFRRVCKHNGYRAFKVDDHFDARQRIVPAIIDSIRRSAFIIADVSEPRPNVYYELGYAQALGKHVIVTAAEGTELPFDIFDIPTLYWDGQTTLQRKLAACITPRAESPAATEGPLK